LTSVARDVGYLAGTDGEKFIDKVWKETVEDIAVVDPALLSFA
jgi:hypothetical protein